MPRPSQKTVGARLRAERERLGLKPTDFAAIGGVGRSAQYLYEANDRVPDVGYMRRLHDAGIDLLYVIVGNRGAARKDANAPVSLSTLGNLLRVIEEHCVDETGQPLPLERRIAFAQLLCIHLGDSMAEDMTESQLQAVVAKLPRRSPAVPEPRRSKKQLSASG